MKKRMKEMKSGNEQNKENRKNKEEWIKKPKKETERGKE